MLDPETVQTRRALPSATATGDERHLWVVHPDTRDRTVLARLDLPSLQPEVAADSPGRAGAAAHLDGDRLWVTDPAGGRLLCLDAETGSARGERDAVLTGPLVADEILVVTAQSGGLRALKADCDRD